MRNRDQSGSSAGIAFNAKRTGADSILYAILHPRKAMAASVNAETVRLQFLWRSLAVPLDEVESVDLVDRYLWCGVRLRHSAGSSEVSGLPRKVASALAEAVETARIDWWRQALSARINSIQSLHDRLAVLEKPPRYLTADALRNLASDAEAVASGSAARWPKPLWNSPEIRMLRDIRRFLDAPESARLKANETYVAGELRRSRQLFDRIESRPADRRTAPGGRSR